ncbi:MAG: nitrate/nitrite transporter NrtS [Cyanobacterium sp. T60_A2020_053]|nr:nitrate/nitrite transporter NrtS [Cyanobacterium sp. T60_A2020_053]
MKQQIISYGKDLINPQCAKKAIPVALFVGTTLFMINHGTALIKGEMNQERWTSALLSYIIPYFVSIHGQWSSKQKPPPKAGRFQSQDQN